MAGNPTDFTTYPAYLQELHQGLMTGTENGATPAYPEFATYGNVAAYFVAATSGVGGSPYSTVEAYDPEPDVTAVQDLLDEWTTDVDAIDPEGDIQAHLTAATTAAGTLVTSGEIDDVVDAFEARSKGAYLREVSRFASGMFDIGAVLTTQMGMGLAHMERDRADQLNDVDARLRLMAERERFGAATQVAMDMARLQMFQFSERRAGIGGNLDVARFNIAARQDQIGLDLGYEISDAVWDLELINYPMQHISGLSGAVALHKQQTPNERLAAGIMQSASFGLQTGVAMGSPAAGFAAGGISLAASLLAGIS